MLRIIDSEHSNLIGEKVRYYRKKENTAKKLFPKNWRLWLYIFAGGLSH